VYLAYFEDLSIYSYHAEFVRPNTLNVGWLSDSKSFAKAMPSKETLSLVWSFCLVSVAQMRGIHDCELCPATQDGEYGSEAAERDGQMLLLGSSEIRVFGTDGTIFAAPTLLYHYIYRHHYAPPDRFIEALGSGPKPPNEKYFKKLEALGLEWKKTSLPQGPRFRLKPK
jgi:hypothetical protein